MEKKDVQYSGESASKMHNSTLGGSLQQNITMLQQIFKNDETIIFREFENEENENMRCCIVYIDSMVNKEIINEHIIKPILNPFLRKNNSNDTVLEFLRKKIVISCGVKSSFNVEEIVSDILYGNTILLVESAQEALIIDTIGWISRGLQESPAETVVRGPREGFTESINTNISLLRRRVNSPNLKFKFQEMGFQTKTKLCVCYIEGIAQEKILQEVMKRLSAIEIDGILESGYIEELIADSPLSPFRTVGSTERPDVAVAKLLEGRIVIVCDGTPAVLTVPNLFIEVFQANEDYYNNYIYASINRMIRWLGFFLTISVPAIYVALVTFHQELIQTRLLTSISNARQGVPFPTIVEALFMLLVFEILREAGLRLPKPIGQAVGIVGTLVLGDAAVNAKFISAPMVIIVAITGISSFLIPQALGVIIIRVIFLVLSSFMGLYGYIFGIMGLVLHMMSIRSFGVPYMLNVGMGTLTAQDLKDTAIRAPWWAMKYRPRFMSINSLRQKSNKKKKG